MTLRIKRETLDDAMTLQGNTLGAAGVLEEPPRQDQAGRASHRRRILWE